jgi:hypothetical protein
VCLGQNVCEISRKLLGWLKSQVSKKRPRTTHHPNWHYPMPRLEHPPRLLLHRSHPKTRMLRMYKKKDHGAQNCPRAQKENPSHRHRASLRIGMSYYIDIIYIQNTQGSSRLYKRVFDTGIRKIYSTFTQGIGPLSKWVDDHIFFRVPCKYINSHNAKRNFWKTVIAEDGGQSRSGSRLWYHGEAMPDNLPAEFDENASCVLKNCGSCSSHPNEDSRFSYCDADIDVLSGQLGIPWEPSKNRPVLSCRSFPGFPMEFTRQDSGDHEVGKGKVQGLH